MLTDTIDLSIQAIQRKQEVQQRKQADDLFQAILAKLNSVCTNIQDVLSCMTLMYEKQVTLEPVLKSGTRLELLDSINTCGNGANEGTLSVETVRTFESLAKAARTELETAWKLCAARYSEGPKGYLAMIAGLTEDPQGAKNLVASIEGIVKENPTKRNISSLVRYVSEAKEKTSSFSLEPEVELFLKKVSAQKATALDLTPQILEWLESRGLMGKLRINF